MLRKLVVIGLVASLTVVPEAFAGGGRPRYQTNIRYTAADWLSNERILCAKHIDHLKLHYGFLADLSKRTSTTLKSEIQLVSMKLDGTDERILKNIVVKYKHEQPISSESALIGAPIIRTIDYNPFRHLIVFGEAVGEQIGRLYLMNDDGIDLRKIHDSAGRPFFFSPDGRYLQYTSHSQVWLYDLETGEHKVLIDNALGGPFSPDGRWIYRLVQGDYRNDFKNSFHLVHVETGKRIVIEDATSLYWSPHGFHLTYTTQKKTNQGYETILYLCQLTEDQLKVLHSLPNASGGLWSPEGRWIAGKDLTDGSIFLLSHQANERRGLLRPSVPYLLPQAHRTTGEPRVRWFSPGPWLSHERLLVYSMEDVTPVPQQPSKTQQTILVVDVHTSSILFRHVLEESCTDQQLSPDGKNLLFRDGKKLKALIENGSRIVELVEM